MRHLVASLLPRLCESRAPTRAKLASQDRDVFRPQPLRPGRATDARPSSRAPTPSSTASPRAGPTRRAHACGHVGRRHPLFSTGLIRTPSRCRRARHAIKAAPPAHSLQDDRPGPARHGIARHGLARLGTAWHGLARLGTTARLDTTLARRCEKRPSRCGGRRPTSSFDGIPTRSAEGGKREHGRAHAHARYRVRSCTSAKSLANLNATKTRVKWGMMEMRKTLKLRRLFLPTHWPIHAQW